MPGLLQGKPINTFIRVLQYREIVAVEVFVDTTFIVIKTFIKTFGALPSFSNKYVEIRLKTRSFEQITVRFIVFNFC